MAAPSSADFAFAAPYPPNKQRRVSLALPASSPRVPWDFRDDTGIAGPSNAQEHQNSPSATGSSPKEPPKKTQVRKTEPQDPAAPLPEKKPRKKWSPEETQMLVEGCNRHGVGNWKTILSDPTLKFDNRSPVDLKDRFRTYFPDAYKKHYPNARTHLSSKVRSTLPDGSSLFEKTRSKRRRPFTEEEDRALKAGYEKHGTVWATIVKDPIFQEQNRRSTDLRDRFRNAFPELYQAAGYKPRNNTSKKKKKEHLIDDSRITGRAATDDQLPVSSSGTTGPVRGVRRRRAQTSQGILLRGGTKSVPQSAAASEYEDSSEDEDGRGRTAKPPAVPKTPVAADKPSMTDGLRNLHLFSPATSVEASFPQIIDTDDEMDMRLISLEPLSSDLLDYCPSSSVLENHPRISRHTGIHTPTHNHHSAWSSPQPSSHNTVNDGGGGGSNPPGSSTTANSNTLTHSQIQTAQQQHNVSGSKVGQSAWGPQDWLSPNPRLDPSFNSPTNTNANSTSSINTANAGVNTSANAAPNGSSTPGTPSSYFSPSSPFTSFNLTPLHTAHPLSPSTTPAVNATQNENNGSAAAAASANSNTLNGNLTNLTTLNLPMNYIAGYYNSHQHHGVIERYDLWPPSTSALALSSSFSAMNNSSAWSSALSGSGGGGPFSGPGSLSAFSSSFGGDIESEVSFEDTHSQTFSDDRGDPDEAVFNGDGTYNPGTAGAYPSTANGTLPSTRAITHHSDYAGDLIFGARGYGIGGGFGWVGSTYGPPPPGGVVGANGGGDPHSVSADGATGLGLIGISTTEEEKSGGEGEGNGEKGDNVVVPRDGKGSINPMQLHASSSVIDEMGLAGITLNDSPPGDVDVDEEMSDAAMEDDDAMDGSRASSSGLNAVDAGSELVSGKTPSPEKQRQRQSTAGKSNSAEGSPVQTRLAGGHLSHSHSPHHQHHHQSQQLHPHPLQQGHLPHHPQAHHTTHNGHSLSLSLGPSTTFSPSSVSLSTPGINAYGGLSRFSWDDLDIVDQQNALVDMNNLTPPATPMMQHAQQLRGGRRYATYGLGLGINGGGLGGNGNAGGGGSLFMQGAAVQGQQEQGHQQQQAQASRSISVPPSEARNANAFTTITPSDGGEERGRAKVVDSMHTVKRSLSSTVHHSHGPSTSASTTTHGHAGHSLSLSTIPPFPSHSEIWRSSTPVAKTSSSSSGAGAGGSASGGNGTTNPSSSTATAGVGNTSGSPSSLFSNLFSPPSTPSSLFSGASAGGSGVTSTGPGVNVNGEAYSNSDLPFLDLHYNFGPHLNPQQLQQNFGTMPMLVDTPATTPGIPTSSSSSSASNTATNSAMTQAELEARQALDLAQPFYFHHAHGNAHAQALQHLGLHPLSAQTQQNQNQEQGASGFGFANASGMGLKGLNGSGASGFNNIPLSLSRQLSQFSFAAAASRSSSQQQLGHQRVQSHQVVNPKDLVLNANGAGAVGVGVGDRGSGGGGVGGCGGGSSTGMGLDSRRKRASWDGGMG